MIEKRDNYQIQLQQAKLRFLSYDQQELIRRCRLEYDEGYLYAVMLHRKYRISRESGNMEYWEENAWRDGNSFAEVLILLDWLCDCREDRYITGRWINIVSHGHYFLRQLQEDKEDPDARRFSQNPEAFEKACAALGGEKIPGGDVSYAIELVDGLRILVQLWYGDEEYPARLCFLWDENVLRYIRYETSWYAMGLLRRRIREKM